MPTSPSVSHTLSSVHQCKHAQLLMQTLQSKTMCFLLAGNSVRQNLRRAGFAFFGIFNGTEFNPDFYKDIEAAVDKQKGAVLVCGVGGILEPLGRGGRQSRLASSSLHCSLLLSSAHQANFTEPVKLPVFFRNRTAALLIARH